MNNEVLEIYEKVKDKLSEEEFQSKMDEILKENEGISFIDDVYAAQQVASNYDTT